MAAPRGLRLTLLRAGVLVLSLVVSVIAVETILRLRYQRSMLATIGGPGPHFAGRRGRLDENPKTPGVPRMMILGDSITFGQGLSDDADLWPERLARRYEREQKRFEMAVYAWPGRDIDIHEQQFAASNSRIAPDVLIYQWFVNDIENASMRPDNRRWWQRTAADAWMRRHSYFYFLIDTRLSRFLPPPDRSYVEYLLDTYGPDTLEWETFERKFHNFAARVAEAVPGVKMLVLYPVMPFSGAYPLQSIHGRMRELAGPHRFDMDPQTWLRSLGGSAVRRDRNGRQLLSLPAAGVGPAVTTQPFYPTRNPLDVIVTITTSGTNGIARQEVGRVDLMDDQGKSISSAPLVVDGGNGDPQDVTVHLDSGQMTGRYVWLVVHKTAAVPMDLNAIGLQVDYGFTVVDPTEVLAGFDTHVNIYDAHPNARAQQVVADAVYEALRGHW
jgi:lysophospholipase L1-like esterase